jgi:hypothetical protein
MRAAAASSRPGAQQRPLEAAREDAPANAPDACAELGTTAVERGDRVVADMQR